MQIAGASVLTEYLLPYQPVPNETPLKSLTSRTEKYSTQNSVRIAEMLELRMSSCVPPDVVLRGLSALLG